MSISVPRRFVRYQTPAIAAMFGAGLRSLMRGGQTVPVDTPSLCITRRLAPVPPPLIAAYADWAGAPPARYADVLPPHMFAYWGLGLLIELTGRAPYNLLSIVNQGCRMRTRRALSAREPIVARAHLADISDDGRRIRIASHIEAGSASAPDGQSIDVMTALPQRDPKPRQHTAADAPQPAYERVGRWAADADDGVNFALLTGDFNPLHTLASVGRRTRYRSCILQGFGMLARTYEAIRNAGVEIATFDVRYIKPVALPTAALDVALARETDAQGNRALRLCSPDATLHLVGHLRERADTS